MLELEIDDLKQAFKHECGRLERSPIEREQALRHINTILDEYLEITVEAAWEEHASGES